MRDAAVDNAPEAQHREAPRRILMTVDAVGGVWTFALDLARGLARHGVEVFLAVMGRALAAEQRREAHQLENVTLCESTFALEWMENPWEEVEQAGAWLLALEQKVQPDLVHLNGYVHAALPWSCPCLVVAHSCVTSWWQAVKKEPLPPSFSTYRTRVAEGLAAADLVTAPTAAMLSSIARHYGPLKNGRVFHNGRDTSLFRPEGKKELILSVGRLWDEAKNVRLLAEQAQALPWPVYVAGEEQHPTGGATVLPNVKRLGQLTPRELAPWFAAAAIYALPARYEPFGLTVLEAALSGCALVLGDIPSLRELWQDAAIFVDPQDGPAWAAALRALCGDPVKRTQLSLQALGRSESYTVAKMAAHYLAAYRWLLSRRPHRDFRQETGGNEAAAAAPPSGRGQSAAAVAAPKR